MKEAFKIVEYDPQWQLMFRSEKRELERVFDENLVSIHHIGSTAIPHTHAKPEIDILLVVKTDSYISRYDHALENLGYDVRGECLANGGVKGRFYYSKDIDHRRTHKLHICQIGHQEILSKLLFVKYLNEHKNAAEAYAKLKIKLAAEFNYGKNFKKYLSGKTNFIMEMLDKARQENSDMTFEDFL